MEREEFLVSSNHRLSTHSRLRAAFSGFIFALVLFVDRLQLAVRVFSIFDVDLTFRHTCKKREIPEIYLRNFFWIFCKILG